MWVRASWFVVSCHCFFGRGVELCSCIGAVVGSSCFRLLCVFNVAVLISGCLGFSVARCFFFLCVECTVVLVDFYSLVLV